MSILNWFGKKNKSPASAPARTESTPAPASPLPEVTATAATSTPKAKVSLEKIERHKVSLEKTIDTLAKTNPRGFLLTKLKKAYVINVIDGSGSMQSSYKNGSVQQILDRLLPLAIRFDDNSELDVYTFSEHCKRLPAMTLNNFENYVQDNRKEIEYGITYYAPALEAIARDYPEPDKPVFVIFITDGDNYDKPQTDAIIKKLSDPRHKVFILFIGTNCNRDDLKYLEYLDNMPGRASDNTASLFVKNFAEWSDEELYSKMLEQYLPWLDKYCKS